MRKWERTTPRKRKLNPGDWRKEMRKLMGAPRLILEAARELEQFGETFTAAELVILTWRKDNAFLGLQGYEHLHPDSNKIMAYLLGKKGLVSRGVLERVGPRTYRVGDLA